MSEKTLDKNGRWRNVNISFRASPEENEEISLLVKLSGQTKQEYLVRRSTQKDVVVRGSCRVYKALRSQIEELTNQLTRIYRGGDIPEEMLERIEFIIDICSKMQDETEDFS